MTRVGYTPKEHSEERFIAEGHFPADLENLERLIQLHQLAFPFENTAMHYTPDHIVDMNPQNLYCRFMDERKGPYCFGQNTVFLHILRGLGYRAYNVAARVNKPNPADYPPYNHVIIFVQPILDSNITYLVDVGFSTMGPTRPILLTDSEKSVTSGTTGTERFRIRRHADPRSSLESLNASANNHLNWGLESQYVNKHAPDPLKAPWILQYRFTEEEFYENDIYNASFSYCTSRIPIYGGQFRNNVVAAKYFLLDSEGNLILDPHTAAREVANTDVSKRNLGKVILVGKDLKFTRGGESEVTVLKTESERISALKDLFGIVITDEERAYIRALPSAMGVE